MALPTGKTKTVVGLSTYSPRHAALERAIVVLRHRYGEFAPSIHEVRRLVDESLGPHSFTEELPASGEHPR